MNQIKEVLFLRLSVFSFIVFLFITPQLLMAAQSVNEPFTFITREGDKLMENGKEFRFISFNCPNLHINEDPTWHRVTPYEQEDAIKTIKAMGGRVVRIYVLSVKGGERQRAVGGGPNHINGPGQYNDTLFQDFDMMLALLNKHKIRVIIPFLDEWSYFGGKKEFAKLYGKSSLYDPVATQGYKDLIKYVLTRKNTITGVEYRNDPAIMAWETGNEMYGEPSGWLHDIATYIKSLDSNHLVADGNCSVRATGTSPNVNDPAVDLLTDHIYNAGGADAHVSRLKKDREMSKGKKPFYLGEFDPRPATSVAKAVFEEIINNGSAGAMNWSLRYHKATGGFYDHLNYDNLYFQYPYHDCTTITRTYGYKIQGLEEPPMENPEPPYLLPISNPATLITWRGSVGANMYTIERAASSDGPWTVVSSTATDNINKPSFKDAQGTSSSYYRVKAKYSFNSVLKESGYSNIRKVGDNSMVGGEVVLPVITPKKVNANLLDFNGEFKITCYNLNGKMVFSNVISSKGSVYNAIGLSSQKAGTVASGLHVYQIEKLLNNRTVSLHHIKGMNTVR
jgi:hypothetical protein